MAGHAGGGGEERMLVQVNGRLVKESEAVISVFDRGFLFGDGIFETLRSVSGRVFRWGRHLARLERSALAIGLELPASGDEIAAATSRLLRANGLREARLRLSVTRGMGRPGDYVKASGPATWVITAVPYSGLDPEIYERGVPIVIAHQRSVPPQSLDPAIKSISRLTSVLARREAFDRGAHEAVLLDAAGNLTEGTASNVFLVKNDVIMTPSLPDGVLPGVTREAVMELAREADNPVVEGCLPGREMDRADEILLTNTCWEIIPVASVDGRPVGAGVPGRWARELLRRYRCLVHRECCLG